MVDNNNSGALFTNDRREKETHPTHKGSATIGGVEYWIDAWVNTAGENSKKPGQKFLGLKFNPKEPAAATAQNTSDDDDDGGFPF